MIFGNFTISDEEYQEALALAHRSTGGGERTFLSRALLLANHLLLKEREKNTLQKTNANTCQHPIEKRINCSRGHTQCMMCSTFSFQFKITQE